MAAIDVEGTIKVIQNSIPNLKHSQCQSAAFGWRRFWSTQEMDAFKESTGQHMHTGREPGASETQWEKHHIKILPTCEKAIAFQTLQQQNHHYFISEKISRFSRCRFKTRNKLSSRPLDPSYCSSLSPYNQSNGYDRL